jgi:hypothetical protein
MGLFDFASFVEELRGDEEEDKRASIERYEAVFGEMPDNIWECAFYKDYLRFFKPVKYNVPEELQDDFDWDLLLQLVAGSFSSEYKLSEGELYITVSQPETETEKFVSVTKTVSELWSFQVLRLFEIYISEQINLINESYLPHHKHKTASEFDSVFINNGLEDFANINSIPDSQNKVSSLDEYFRMCSYLPLSKEGKDLIFQRFDKIVKYKLQVVQSSNELETFFVINPDSAKKKLLKKSIRYKSKDDTGPF